jgi:hypothetical protein
LPIFLFCRHIIAIATIPRANDTKNRKVETVFRTGVDMMFPTMSITIAKNKLAMHVYRSPRKFWLASLLKHFKFFIFAFIAFAYAAYFWNDPIGGTSVPNRLRLAVYVFSPLSLLLIFAYYHHKELTRRRELFLLTLKRRKELRRR